eukprot:5070530-Lingulodinium_polyedra.AAC.1
MSWPKRLSKRLHVHGLLTTYQCLLSCKASKASEANNASEANDASTASKREQQRAIDRAK